MVTKDEVRPVSIDTLGPQNANLFLIEDIEDAGRTKSLAQSDLTALRAVADWTKSFVIRPHKDLGLPGPVCPFTPVAIEHKAFWLAAERSAGRSKPEVIGLIKGYHGCSCPIRLPKAKAPRRLVQALGASLRKLRGRGSCRRIAAFAVECQAHLSQ